jgi:hypothetical protein
MNEAAATGYETAIKLTDKTARTIWSIYGALLATNGFLISLSAFLLTQGKSLPIVIKGIGALGLLICLCWYLISLRTFDFYRFYFAWARKLEEDAFGTTVEMVRSGGAFARGDTCTIGASSERMRWGSRLFKVEWLIYVVIATFAIIYSYLVLA